MTERENATPQQDFDRFVQALKLRVVRRFADKYAGLRLSDVTVRAGAVVTTYVTLSGTLYRGQCYLDDGMDVLSALIPYSPEQLADLVSRRTTFIAADSIENFDIRAAILSDAQQGTGILP